MDTGGLGGNSGRSRSSLPSFGTEIPLEAAGEAAGAMSGEAAGEAVVDAIGEEVATVRRTG